MSRSLTRTRYNPLPIAMKHTLRDALVIGVAAALATASASCKRQPPAKQPPAEQLPVGPPSPSIYVAPMAAAPSPQPMPDGAFRVEWVANTMPPVMKPGARQQVKITVRNIGVAQWPDIKSTGSRPQGAVRIGYRWLPVKAAPVPPPYARVRSNLASPVATGQTAELTLEVLAPETPGPYRIQFDLVQEFVSWFETKGAARLIIPVRVGR